MCKIEQNTLSEKNCAKNTKNKKISSIHAFLIRNVSLKQLRK